MINSKEFNKFCSENKIDHKIAWRDVYNELKAITEFNAFKYKLQGFKTKADYINSLKNREYICNSINKIIKLKIETHNNGQCQ